MEDTTKYLKYINKETKSIYDWACHTHIGNFDLKREMANANPLRKLNEYKDTYQYWIRDNSLNCFRDFEFGFVDFVSGTTQTFDELYFVNKNKRLRIFRGEYAYHKRITDFTFIEDEELDENDWVLVSLPFCSTGDIHTNMIWLIEECEKKKIEVHIDCAYYGGCRNINFSFDSECIKSVSFSLSKSLCMGDFRVGIRYSKHSTPIISQHNNYNHLNFFGVSMGIHMMQKFKSDYIPLKYGRSHDAVCDLLQLKSSNTMHIATTENNEYNIDKMYNRVGIRDAVKRFYNDFKLG